MIECGLLVWNNLIYYIFNIFNKKKIWFINKKFLPYLEWIFFFLFLF